MTKPASTETTSSGPYAVTAATAPTATLDISMEPMIVRREPNRSAQTPPVNTPTIEPTP